MKKLIVINFSLFEIFCENHQPTCHIKYKLIDFAPNKSITANRLPSTNLD